MNITNIKITKVEGRSERLLGYADVTVNDALAIHSIKIIRGDEKNFIAFPSIKKTDGTYSDIVHPINQATRKIFEDAILKEYELAE